MKDMYIRIISNVLEFPAKGILSANHIRSAGHFYDEKPKKLGGEQQLVSMNVREIDTFISDGLAYLPFRCPTDEEIKSFPKVILTPYREWKPLHIDDDAQ